MFGILPPAWLIISISCFLWNCYYVLHCWNLKYCFMEHDCICAYHKLQRCQIPFRAAAPALEKIFPIFNKYQHLSPKKSWKLQTHIKMFDHWNKKAVMKNYISLFALTACLILDSDNLVKKNPLVAIHFMNSFHELISFQNMFISFSWKKSLGIKTENREIVEFSWHYHWLRDGPTIT